MAAKVKVVARLRPFVGAELTDDGVIVSPQDGTISVVNPRVPTERFKFHFSSCYDQTSTQEVIFSKEVKPLISHVFHGLVCTVFAYGVTSSGKTHTIQGTTEQPGIIPRVVIALLEKKREMSQKMVSLSLSYMEIYKDEAYDLLVPRDSACKLPIREDPSGKIIVTNLTEKPILSFQEFEKLFSVACKGRSTGMTNLNHASSRSHAMLSLSVTCLDPFTRKALVGKLNLVDLAGSENNKLTGNDPARMAESSAINKSLTVLGQVVHALNTNAPRIPYRDSKLTRILQDALGGTAIGLLICNLAPSAKLRQDTLNTLNFATRTKQVENKIMVNEKDMQPLMVKVPMSSHAPPALSLRPAILQPSDRGRSSLGGANIYQTSAIPSLINAFGSTNCGRSSLPGCAGVSEMGAKDPLPDMELDEKISRAVQQEVERRLAERETQERERLRELEERERERAAERQRQEEEQRAMLMRKHDELNRLLKKTLRKAEKENYKNMDGNDKPEVALSPKKARKLAVAYVSLGREYLQSKEPDYNSALKFWQQAETYVPDNQNLKKRIAELEVAVREGVVYKPLARRSKFNRLSEHLALNSPSGSRDHKESRKLRLKVRLASMKAHGEFDPALIRTPTPTKDANKKQDDVFVDSDEEMFVSEPNQAET